MVFSARKFSLIISVLLLLLPPLTLYADWSFIPRFLAPNPKDRPAVDTAVPETVKSVPHQSSGQAEIPAAEPAAPQTPLPEPAIIESSPPAAPDIVIEKPSEPAMQEDEPVLQPLPLRSQTLTVDSEWRDEVHVDGGITVGPAATLTIRPGTVVRFARNSGIHILGRIVIKGTKANPVLFSSIRRESQDSDWSGIYLSGSEKNNIFENVVIEGAETAIFARFSTFSAAFVEIRRSSSGLRLQNSFATIANTVIAVPVTAVSAVKSEIYLEKSSIVGGQSGVIIDSSSLEAVELSVKSCRLAAVSAAASRLRLVKLSVSASQQALRLDGCEGSVTDSFFTDNLETGVVLAGSSLRFSGNTVSGNRVGMQIDDNLPSLWSNSISGNSGYNLIFLGDETFFAGGNNFVESNGSDIDSKIFSKRPGAVQITPVFASEPVMLSK